jgi:hypothetical protein
MVAKEMQAICNWRLPAMLGIIVLVMLGGSMPVTASRVGQVSTRKVLRGASGKWELKPEAFAGEGGGIDPHCRPRLPTIQLGDTPVTGDLPIEQTQLADPGSRVHQRTLQALDDSQAFAEYASSASENDEDPSSEPSLIVGVGESSGIVR